MEKESESVHPRPYNHRRPLLEEEEECPEEYSLKWHTFHSLLSSGLKQLLVDGADDVLTDVTLVAEGHCIRSHRMLLSLCSPHFKKLFQQGSAYTPHGDGGTHYVTPTNTIIILSNVKFRDLRNIIQFIYNGEVKVEGSQELKGFLQTGELLQIDGLVNRGDNMKAPHFNQESEAPEANTSFPSSSGSGQQPLPRRHLNLNQSQLRKRHHHRFQPKTNPPIGKLTVESQPQLNLSPHHISSVGSTDLCGTASFPLVTQDNRHTTVGFGLGQQVLKRRRVEDNGVSVVIEEAAGGTEERQDLVTMADSKAESSEIDIKHEISTSSRVGFDEDNDDSNMIDEEVLFTMTNHGQSGNDISDDDPLSTVEPNVLYSQMQGTDGRNILDEDEEPTNPIACRRILPTTGQLCEGFMRKRFQKLYRKNEPYLVVRLRCSKCLTMRSLDRWDAGL